MKALSIDNSIERLSTTMNKEVTLRTQEIETLHSKSLDFIECGYLNFLIDQVVSNVHQNYYESKQIMMKIHLFRRELRTAYILCNSLIDVHHNDVQLVKHLRSYQMRLHEWNRSHSKFHNKHLLLKLLKDEQLFNINKMRINV